MSQVKHRDPRWESGIARSERFANSFRAMASEGC
jgi:hypothetical protein